MVRLSIIIHFGKILPSESFGFGSTASANKKTCFITEKTVKIQERLESDNQCISVVS